MSVQVDQIVIPACFVGVATETVGVVLVGRVECVVESSDRKWNLWLKMEFRSVI